MTSFKIALTNVLITLLFVLPGFILGKTKKASTEHLSTMSAVLIYVLSPCMIVSSFLQLDFSLENLGRMGIFFAITLILQSAFMLALFLIFRKKYNDSKYRILTIGSVLGNVGFFGQPIIRALLPDFPEALCYSSVYVVSMNILVFSVGVFCLTNDALKPVLSGACGGATALHIRREAVYPRGSVRRYKSFGKSHHPALHDNFRGKTFFGFL